jgi:hypothetical protein
LKDDLTGVAHQLKETLATGDSVKDGTILLQRDQRDRIKEDLSKLGFPEAKKEVQRDGRTPAMRSVRLLRGPCRIHPLLDGTPLSRRKPESWSL